MSNFDHIYSQDIIDAARATLLKNRVAIFIVCYHAEKHIESVLARIPPWVSENTAEIYIIDDSSKDNTVEIASAVKWLDGKTCFKVFRTPYNQGYGGNQRLGYLYAISQKFDIVVLLHGDGQYAPEYLPEILAEYTKTPTADAVYGSRFLTKRAALRGGMPFYKYVGNRILTRLQNRIIGSRLSELHSGYRSYKVASLKKVPFELNSQGFDFDSDIIIQFTAAGMSIQEVDVPTFYGDEICRVNGIKYALACIKSALKYRLMQYEIFHDPKYDIPNRNRKYTIKKSDSTVHGFIQKLDLPSGSALFDFGGGDGAVSLPHAEKGVKVTVIDQAITVNDALGSIVSNHPNVSRIAFDLDQNWLDPVGTSRFSSVFALDVLEHLKSPESALKRIFEVMQSGGTLYASTGNISYIIIRIMHVMGFFNYGRRGILDLTHTRLFTVYSFQRIITNAGFRIDRVVGFGPPISDLSESPTKLLSLLDKLSLRLARIWKGLFAYQVLIVATRPKSIQDLINETFVDKRST